ncbi:DUF6419 family natural product biosynthesis protein [Spongiibacter marinus]|uniref:DUF6419 family natural product biosynthesis protein n=1 Tax=Spongiibacter marinus TaxID=354246 RepID=UPI003564C88B
MLQKSLIVLAITISVACMVMAAAPFTPAIGVSFLMLLLSGLAGYKGYIQTALILLLINIPAVILSPGIDVSKTETLIFFLSILIISLTGVMLGVKKSRLNIVK